MFPKFILLCVAALAYTHIQMFRLRALPVFNKYTARLIQRKAERTIWLTNKHQKHYKTTLAAPLSLAVTVPTHGMALNTYMPKHVYLRTPARSLTLAVKTTDEQANHRVKHKRKEEPKK